MQKITFKNNVDFWQIASFANTRKIHDFILLEQAFNQNALKEKNKGFLKKFIDYFKECKNIKSQLYQDVFASFIISNKFEKTFLEFGATDGLEFSNSFMLENLLGWKGVLSEPSSQWHNLLKKNRANTKIITKCIWSETGKTLDFFMSDEGIYSTLNDFVDNDKNSMPGNTEARRLDAVIYRAKFATTIFSARQLINHGHVRVNGKKVNISSYSVKEEDTIEIRDKSKQLAIVDIALANKERETPEYIQMDEKNKKFKFIRVPKFEEVPYPIVMEPNLVIEYYSR